MSSQIKSKYILITGATSDIGQAIATILSSNQYNLILHGRNRVKLEAVLAKLETKTQIVLWCQDLNLVDEVQSSFVSFIDREDIIISGFVHCAAAIRILPIRNFRLDYSREIFNVNVFSSIEIIKTLVKKFNIEHLSNIIFISAYFSKYGDKGNSIYAASKGAIDSLVKSLAVELAPRVKVNSILPGAVKTKMTAHLFEDPSYMKEFNKKYLLGEGSSTDIANMVSFLLSPQSSWITGQNFQVDGGASSH